MLEYLDFFQNLDFILDIDGVLLAFARLVFTRQREMKARMI